MVRTSLTPFKYGEAAVAEPSQRRLARSRSRLLGHEQPAKAVVSRWQCPEFR